MTTKRIGLTTAIALWAGMGATSAQAVQAAKPCVTEAEATGLFLFIAPDAIKAAGTVCAATLPSNALLRQTSGGFVEKYRAEAETAWPMAKAAVAKIAGEEMKDILDTDAARPMMSALLAPIIAKDIKTKDCAKINRIVTLIAPLPPRNAAELVVTVLQMRKEKGPKDDLPICPAVGS